MYVQTAAVLLSIVVLGVQGLDGHFSELINLSIDCFVRGPG